MAVSFYELSVMNYLQTLQAVAGFLDKSLGHLREACIDPEVVMETRLYPDMWPFRLQVQSVVHHSKGAMDGVMGGRFAPPSGLPEQD